MQITSFGFPLFLDNILSMAFNKKQIMVHKHQFSEAFELAEGMPHVRWPNSTIYHEFE